MSSPTHPSHSKDHSTDYHYFVAVVALVLLAANMFVVGCRCCLCQPIQRFFRWRGPTISSSNEEAGVQNNHISRLISVCKYTKATITESKCAVCLATFLDGEEVRQLPGCKHAFHVQCIDMWLHSHVNCSMCRADVLRVQREASPMMEGSLSWRSLIETGSTTGVVVSIL